MFAERGFQATTGDDVATALGVGRRTIFRYFLSKNDIVWGDFGAACSPVCAAISTLWGVSRPIVETVARAAVSSNRYPPRCCRSYVPG